MDYSNNPSNLLHEVCPLIFTFYTPLVVLICETPFFRISLVGRGGIPEDMVERKEGPFKFEPVVTDTGESSWCTIPPVDLRVGEM